MFNENERKSYDKAYKMEGLLLLAFIIIAITGFGVMYIDYFHNLFSSITEALDIIK